MAKLIKSKQGYKVVKMAIEEVTECFETLGKCDCCNGVTLSGFYLPVLNSYYCSMCYNAWEKRATFYPEDVPVETRRYNFIKPKLHFNNG